MKLSINIEKDIGQQIRYIRESLQLSREDVAQNIGVSQALLSYYENNKRMQSIDVLRNFLQYCRQKCKPN
jgi:transcriptional regulator with XRE-family HTH domain